MLFRSKFVWEQGVAEADKLQGTPVVSLKDFGDKDNSKDKYGRTVPKKLKKDDPRVKFHKDPKQQGVAEATNPEDVICVDVPLFIRLMEYAREDASTDMDLHRVTERLTELSANGTTVNMDSYDKIVGIENEIKEEEMNSPLEQGRKNIISILKAAEQGQDAEIVIGVVQQDAGPGHDLAGSHPAVDRLRGGDGIAFVVEQRKVGRVVRLLKARLKGAPFLLGKGSDRAGGQRTLAEREASSLGEVLAAEERLLWDRREVGIAEKAGSVGEGELHRLGDPVQAALVTGAPLAEATPFGFEQTEHLGQEDPARAGRRHHGDLVVQEIGRAHV